MIGEKVCDDGFVDAVRHVCLMGVLLQEALNFEVRSNNFNWERYAYGIGLATFTLLKENMCAK